MKLKYIILPILSIVMFLIWQNNDIVITQHNYNNSKLSNRYNGFKILHISDFHNKNFHGRLTSKIKEINPNIIVITGDLIDRRNPNLHIAKDFVKEIVKVAPVYYVSGNHEQLSVHYEELKEILNNLDVINMDNSYIKLNYKGSEIGLIGIADPVIIKNKENCLFEDSSSYIRSNLKNLTNNINTNFNILLSHRPEHFNIYKEFNLDLIFSGHAHGGQIRLPLLGGILAPDQGFFPKYSEGMCKEGSTSIVVSRGLGNSIFPFRIFNRPELVLVSLNGE